MEGIILLSHTTEEQASSQVQYNRARLWSPWVRRGAPGQKVRASQDPQGAGRETPGVHHSSVRLAERKQNTKPQNIYATLPIILTLSLNVSILHLN